VKLHHGDLFVLGWATSGCLGTCKVNNIINSLGFQYSTAQRIVSINFQPFNSKKTKTWLVGMCSCS